VAGGASAALLRRAAHPATTPRARASPLQRSARHGLRIGVRSGMELIGKRLMAGDATDADRSAQARKPPTRTDCDLHICCGLVVSRFVIFVSFCKFSLQARRSVAWPVAAFVKTRSAT